MATDEDVNQSLCDCLYKVAEFYLSDPFYCVLFSNLVLLFLPFSFFMLIQLNKLIKIDK